MKPTPRTDEQVMVTVEDGRDIEVVPDEHARTLKLELQKARLAAFDSDTAVGALQRELAAAKEELAELHAKNFRSYGYVTQHELKLQLGEVREVLEGAVETIKVWHNMDGSTEDVWQIYLNNAPEMKRITNVIRALAERGKG